MKRAARCITVFIVSFSVIVCSSLSVFAYHPVIEINSEDWKIDSPFTYSAVYPNQISGYDWLDEDLYKNSQLNGESYYFSQFWRDDYPLITESEIIIPELPTGDSWSQGNSLKSMYKIIFRCLDSFYVAFFSGVNKIYLSDEGYLNFDVTRNHGEIEYHKLTYPFSSWHFDGNNDFYGDRTTCMFGNMEGIYAVDVLYSDFDVYSSDFTTVVHAKDYTSIVGYKYKIVYEKPVTVVTGSMSVHIDKNTISRLSFGSFAFLIDNCGFIPADDIGLLNYAYTLSVQQNGNVLASSEIIPFSYDTRIDNYNLEFAKPYLYNEFSILDVNIDLSVGVEFVFNYTFVTDSFVLFFPGHFQFVEFESYEDDLEHDEVMNAIKDASDVISGSITSSSSALANEIAATYDKLVTSTQPKPDLSVDTGEVDNIVAEEEEILNNIYDDINSRTDEYLKVIGFSSIEGLFDEKINDLNNDQLSVSFDFVKSLFDQVVSVTGISTLVFFSLCFGFCIYVLGRRLS